MSAKTSSPASIGDRLRSVLKRQVLNKNLKPHLRRIPEEEREGEYLRLASRIGARYASCTLDTYELSDHENQREVFGQCEKYAADMEKNTEGYHLHKDGWTEFIAVGNSQQFVYPTTLIKLRERTCVVFP